jgi:hypothetical protein
MGCSTLIQHNLQTVYLLKATAWPSIYTLSLCWSLVQHPFLPKVRLWVLQNQLTWFVWTGSEKDKMWRYTYMVDHVQHRCLIFTNYACPYKTRSVNSVEYTKTLQEGQGAPLRSSTICRQFSCWKRLIDRAYIPFQAYGIILRQYGVIYPDNDLPIIFCHMYSWLCVLLSKPSIMLRMSSHRLCNAVYRIVRHHPVMCPIPMSDKKVKGCVYSMAELGWSST